MRQSALICLLFLVALMISACAAPQLKKEELMFEPVINKVISNEKTITVYIEDFGFAKTISNPKVVGQARVGMFNSRALIHSEDPVHLIITDQLKRVFLKAGFKLDEKEKAHFRISGRVERFWVAERIGGPLEGAKASVRYDLIVKDAQGRFVWGNNIVGRATSRKSMDATKDDISTLSSALKNSIEAFFKNEGFWKVVE